MLQARLDALTALSHSPLLDNDAHLPDFYRAAQNIKRIYGDDLLLVDRQGRVLMHTARPLGTPLSPVSWPKGRAAAPMVFATGRPAVGDAFIGPLLQTQVVVIAVPVGTEGRPERALAMLLTGAPFQQLVASAALPADWAVASHQAPLKAAAHALGAAVLAVTLIGGLAGGAATFRAVFAGLPDAAVFTDADRRIRLVNPAFEAQFGVAAAEIVGRETSMLYTDPQSFDAVGRRLRALMADEQRASLQLQVQLQRPQGSRFWAESTTVRWRRAPKPSPRSTTMRPAATSRSTRPWSSPTSTRPHSRCWVTRATRSSARKSSAS